ncbi:MAG: hypothetical protein HYU59_04455 [Magnetospirillum gryphiswaldense]|nr:hypothetical protein [Magnetospirillum gryphiswaldense]
MLALYHCALEHPDTSIWVDEAAEIVGCGGQLAIICLNSLAAKKLVDRGAKSGRPTVFMTLAGFAEVDSWEHEIYSRAASVFPGKTNATLENESVTSPQIPASDRTVPLNHNQPEYRDAVSALDKVIEEFRNDHRSALAPHC